MVFLSPSLSMNPNWGKAAICEYLENVQKGIPGYFVLFFCFCENTFWLKATWKEMSLFQLMLLGHGPSLRELRAGSQEDLRQEPWKNAASYIVHWLVLS